MVAISQPWYNGSYTIAAKPIKTLESHYTMIQFSIIIYIYIYKNTFNLADPEDVLILAHTFLNFGANLNEKSVIYFM